MFRYRLHSGDVLHAQDMVELVVQSRAGQKAAGRDFSSRDAKQKNPVKTSHQMLLSRCKFGQSKGQGQSTHTYRIRFSQKVPSSSGQLLATWRSSTWPGHSSRLVIWTIMMSRWMVHIVYKFITEFHHLITMATASQVTTDLSGTKLKTTFLLTWYWHQYYTDVGS